MGVTGGLAADVQAGPGQRADGFISAVISGPPSGRPCQPDQFSTAHVTYSPKTCRDHTDLGITEDL